MKRLTLTGKSAAKGVVEAEALVTDDMISFIDYCDLMTGVVTDPTSKIKGQSIAGKVFVFPMGRGSTASPYAMCILKKSGKCPAAIINRVTEADTTIITGAVLTDIPMVYALDRDPMTSIETGDMVRVDGNRGVVEVMKKG